jgi:hypothetical protein
MSDQCAVDEFGNLKEAKDIDFVFSESETSPLPSAAAPSQHDRRNAGKSNMLYLRNFNVAMS